jgi:hypothetical protein
MSSNLTEFIPATPMPSQQELAELANFVEAEVLKFLEGREEVEEDERETDIVCPQNEDEFVFDEVAINTEPHQGPRREEDEFAFEWVTIYAETPSDVKGETDFQSADSTGAEAPWSSNFQDLSVFHSWQLPCEIAAQVLKNVLLRRGGMASATFLSQSSTELEPHERNILQVAFAKAGGQKKWVLSFPGVFEWHTDCKRRCYIKLVPPRPGLVLHRLGTTYPLQGGGSDSPAEIIGAHFGGASWR